ncbi:hypothetical protein LCGC14_2230740, partial [marine sediment metagenome]
YIYYLIVVCEFISFFPTHSFHCEIYFINLSNKCFDC